MDRSTNKGLGHQPRAPVRPTDWRSKDWPHPRPKLVIGDRKPTEQEWSNFDFDIFEDDTKMRRVLRENGFSVAYPGTGYLSRGWRVAPAMIEMGAIIAE